MSKVVILGSDDCDTCQKLRRMISEVGEDVEYVDVDSEEGERRVDQIARSGFTPSSVDMPMCVIDYGDGTYDACDAEGIFDKLKKRLNNR